MAENTSREWAHAGSVAAHDPHKLTATALQLATDEEVERWALDVLELRAAPAPGPAALQLTAADALPWDGPTMDAIAGLDLAATVNVRLTARPPEREWKAVAARISHRVRPGEWRADVDLRDPAAAGPGGYDSATTRYGTAQYGEAVMH